MCWRRNKNKLKGKEEENYKQLSINKHLIDVHPISDKLKEKFGLFSMTYQNLCLLVAVNVAIENHKYNTSAKTTTHQSAWKSARRQNTTQFVQGVQELYKKCKCDFTYGASFSIIQEVEQALEIYRLVVYDGRTNISVRYTKVMKGQTRRPHSFFIMIVKINISNVLQKLVHF